jgi:hypothetical protein
MATKVKVKDKNGNLITVYDTDIPSLIKEGTLSTTLPSGTTHTNIMMDFNLITLENIGKSVYLYYYDFWQSL